MIFTHDVTPKNGPRAGRRVQMEEVGLYTVKGGKIVREEFYTAWDDGRPAGRGHSASGM